LRTSIIDTIMPALPAAASNSIAVVLIQIVAQHHIVLPVIRGSATPSEYPAPGCLNGGNNLKLVWTGADMRATSDFY
jgi:hypothetical protein